MISFRKHIAIWLLTALFVNVDSVLQAQNQDNFCGQLEPTNNATSFGIGGLSLLDAYLSPLRYEGRVYSLQHERLKALSMFGRRILMQQQFGLQFVESKNPTKTAINFFGTLSYSNVGLFPIYQTSNLSVYGGGMFDFSLGGIYNTRNSNNIGSLKSSLNLGLSVMALYKWKDFTFRWQGSTPVIGLFFTPKYGQSYYEIFELKNSEGTVKVGSFANQIAFRQRITVDYPIWNITLRAGIASDFYKTNAYNLTTRINSTQFTIGIVYEAFHFGGKQIKKYNINSSYY